MENVRNHRDIKLVMTNKRRNMLVSEPNYHTTKHFFKKLLAFEMKKKGGEWKQVYLGLLILDICSITMYNY